MPIQVPKLTRLTCKSAAPRVMSGTSCTRVLSPSMIPPSPSEPFLTTCPYSLATSPTSVTCAPGAHAEGTAAASHCSRSDVAVGPEKTWGPCRAGVQKAERHGNFAWFCGRRENAAMRLGEQPSAR